MSEKEVKAVDPKSVDPNFCVHWCVAIECETECLRCGHACNEHSTEPEDEQPFCIGGNLVDCTCEGPIDDFPEEDNV